MGFADFLFKDGREGVAAEVGAPAALGKVGGTAAGVRIAVVGGGRLKEGSGGVVEDGSMRGGGGGMAGATASFTAGGNVVIVDGLREEDYVGEAEVEGEGDHGGQKTSPKCT